MAIMSDPFYSATKENVKDWLDGDGEFLAPQQILSDLTEDQAVTVPQGSPYSVAQILNHMHYWRGGRFAKERGDPWPKAEHLDETFAPIPPGTWEELVASFLRDLESIKKLADAEAEYDYVS